MRKIPAAIAAGAVAGVLTFAGLAHGHIATAEGNCVTGVSFSATNYDKTVVNTSKVTIDSVVVHQDLDFKAFDGGNYPTDKTKSHIWIVDIDAPGTQWDHHLRGQYQACQEIPPTTTAAPTTTVTPTTEAPTTTVRVPTQDNRTFTATGDCQTGVTWSSDGFINSQIVVTVDGSTALSGALDSTTASGRIHTDMKSDHSWSVAITGQPANAVGSYFACESAPTTTAVNVPTSTIQEPVQLPATGSRPSTPYMAWIGLFAFVAGSFALLAARRRHA